MTRDRHENFEKVRDEDAFPPTMPSADRSTTLHRFRVDAVVYAPSLEEARSRVANCIELDGATVGHA